MTEDVYELCEFQQSLGETQWILQLDALAVHCISPGIGPHGGNVVDDDALGGGKGPRSALLIRSEWCQEIFKGKKRWEIRSQPTVKRERICIAPSGAGTLMGEATIVAGWDAELSGGMGALGLRVQFSLERRKFGKAWNPGPQGCCEAQKFVCLGLG